MGRGSDMDDVRKNMQFPQASLTQKETIPKITPKRASELITLLGDTPSIKGAAICVAVWQGGVVKWLVNDDEARRTVENLREAEKEGDKK